jgi:quinoprotein glucose dehydrogenase
MTGRVSRSVLGSLSIVAAFGLIASTAKLSGQTGASGQPSTKNGEWTHYTADVKGSRYTPLDQINASNFNQLEVAWRFRPTTSARAPSSSSKARR